jgi:hypothetical protein
VLIAVPDDLVRNLTLAPIPVAIAQAAVNQRREEDESADEIDDFHVSLQKLRSNGKLSSGENVPVTKEPTMPKQVILLDEKARHPADNDPHSANSAGHPAAVEKNG